METLANTLRGEAPLRIGDVDLKIGIEFAALAKLSRAIKAESLEEIYRRLLGFEPWAVSCALRCFTLHDEGVDEAAATALRAINRLSAADEPAWHAAIETAMAGHVDAGHRLRADRPLSDEVDDAVLGKPGSLS
ncbi:hypothetical protein P6U16_08385 [Rhizobium sp. 32-5/1]|uniref:hypothetical protein n=1 Tax=Rhizobium sp. 32-5/1 TaxID=3019602 RepID=UPI00240DE01D|nr:hypothetical protein [Rhizobium sp. 32-5/1]WEZ84577.1 hypothetical protein P6U16_08385 [Rhizobium sp. 32-5/1]